MNLEIKGQLQILSQIDNPTQTIDDSKYQLSLFNSQDLLSKVSKIKQSNSHQQLNFKSHSKKYSRTDLSQQKAPFFLQDEAQHFKEKLEYEEKLFFQHNPHLREFQNRRRPRTALNKMKTPEERYPQLFHKSGDSMKQRSEFTKVIIKQIIENPLKKDERFQYRDTYQKELIMTKLNQQAIGVLSKSSKSSKFLHSNLHSNTQKITSQKPLKYQLTNASIKIRDLIKGKPIQLETQQTQQLIIHNQNDTVDKDPQVIKKKKISKYDQMMLFQNVNNKHSMALKQKFVSWNMIHKSSTILLDNHMFSANCKSQQNDDIGSIFLSHPLPSKAQILKRFHKQQSNTFYLELKVSHDKLRNSRPQSALKNAINLKSSQQCESLAVNGQKKILTMSGSKQLLATQRFTKIGSTFSHSRQPSSGNLTGRKPHDSICKARFGLANLNFNLNTYNSTEENGNQIKAQTKNLLFGDDEHSFGISGLDNKSYFNGKQIKGSNQLSQQLMNDDIIGVLICLDGLAKELDAQEDIEYEDQDFKQVHEMRKRLKSNRLQSGQILQSSNQQSLHSKTISNGGIQNLSKIPQQANKRTNAYSTKQNINNQIKTKLRYDLFIEVFQNGKNVGIMKIPLDLFESKSPIYFGVNLYQNTYAKLQTGSQRPFTYNPQLESRSCRQLEIMAIDELKKFVD